MAVALHEGPPSREHVELRKQGGMSSRAERLGASLSKRQNKNILEVVLEK